MLEELKKQVCEANLELVARGVVIYTWGNVSGIDRDKNLVVIKPSGVAYDNMTPEDMVVVDLTTSETVEGKWKLLLIQQRILKFIEDILISLVLFTRTP